MSFQARLTSVGYSTSNVIGSVLRRIPSLERRMFSPIDVHDLSLAAKLRTLPALWNARAMASLDVPWWTWDSIVEVEDFLAARPSARVFEWGSGASTCWLARRSTSVTSVEHHLAFASSMRPELAKFSNVELLERPARPITPATDGTAVRSGKEGNENLDFREYVHAIDEKVDAQFDLIVVDGRARAACLARAAEHLAPDGMVVLDNSDRPRYAKALNAVARGKAMHRHHGFGPASPVPWETTIVVSDAG